MMYITSAILSWSHKLTLVQFGKIHKDIISGGGKSLGVILEAGYHKRVNKRTN